MNVPSTIQHESDQVQFVTVRIAGQLFGLPIWNVHDVFIPQQITVVPLAPAEVDGVLNLRGRIVTAINMRKRLGFPVPENGASVVAVGVDYQGEAYGLLVDEVGEVLPLYRTAMTPNPPNLDRRWAEITNGVYTLDAELMAVMDVERVLISIKDNQAAA